MKISFLVIFFFSQIFGRCQHPDNRLDPVHHRLHQSVQLIRCSLRSIAKITECNQMASISINWSVWTIWKALWTQWMAIWMVLVPFYAAVQKVWTAHSNGNAWFVVTKMWVLLWYHAATICSVWTVQIVFAPVANRHAQFAVKPLFKPFGLSLKLTVTRASQHTRNKRHEPRKV